jgi:hypothetical protein
LILFFGNSLPEDELFGSKYVEDIQKIKNLNINLGNVHFVGIYCVVLLQYNSKYIKKYMVLVVVTLTQGNVQLAILVALGGILG